MDKRTLLALALSFLVFFMWSVLFGPKPKDGPVDKKEGIEQEVERPVLQEREIPPGPGQDLMVEAASPGKDITVENELYKAIFSGSGPFIKSFKLKKYRSTLEKDSPLKELIDVRSNNGYGFNIDFSGQRTPLTHWTAYKATGEDIMLRSGDRPAELAYGWKPSEGTEIIARFLFHADEYKVDLSVFINNNSPYTINDSLSLNLIRTPEKARGRYGAFEGMALLFGNKLKEIKESKLQEQQFAGHIPWVAYEEQFFMNAIINKKTQGSSVKSMILPTGEAKISYIASSLNLAQRQSSTGEFILFFGPRDLYVLKSLDQNIEKAVYFGWFDVIAKPLLMALRFFNKYLSNYGLSIILLTIIIKLLFWPLTHKSYKSMREMKKLQPMMTKIREKYKDNKQEMQKQLMGLYKTYKINPMGGCLPMLVQIPVFFALLRILPNSIELQHAPFVLWINDLSAPDRLFSFPFQIPLMAPPYGIPVLTLLMGVSMFVQQKMTPVSGDPPQRVCCLQANKEPNQKGN